MKKQGKNAVRFFAPNMDAAARARLRLETRLGTAIAAQALSLHFQPQVDVVGGRLVGVEALARWTDAELGAVGPAEFIPVAEATGMIVPLGAWVLDEACRQAAEWRLDVPVAVNVSPAQLIREDFVDVVAATLARHAVRPERLKLELTERLTVQDPGRAAQQLTRLRALGVILSLDDFGAGTSAVASLLTLPLQEVKLDRSLLAGVTEDPSSWQVLRALLALARSLNLPVVVEGVETPGQLAALRALGCAAVQGFLTGRPAAPEVMGRRLDLGRLSSVE
nr:EAL domain-containing protein [Deinococcus aerophilus]